MATDSQRSYLRLLTNKAFAKGINPGKWAGLDSRQSINSDYLTKSDASDWIKYLIAITK